MGIWDVRVAAAMVAKRVGRGASRLLNTKEQGQVTRRTMQSIEHIKHK